MPYPMHRGPRAKRDPHLDLPPAADAAFSDDDPGAPGYYLRKPGSIVACATQIAGLLRSPVRLSSVVHGSAEPPRAGANDWRRWPSRRGNTRYYQDGRQEGVES